PSRALHSFPTRRSSDLMYANGDVAAGYGTLPVELVEVFLRFRFAVQAWYFADRIRRGDLTGTDAAGNAKGYGDGRAMLRDGIERDRKSTRLNSSHRTIS